MTITRKRILTRLSSIQHEPVQGFENQPMEIRCRSPSTVNFSEGRVHAHGCTTRYLERAYAFTLFCRHFNYLIDSEVIEQRAPLAIWPQAQKDE